VLSGKQNTSTNTTFNNINRKKMPFHQIYENISLNCYPINSIVKLFWLFDLLWYDAFAVTY